MNKQKKPLYFYYLLILIVIVAGNMLFSAMEQSRIKDVSYNTFIKQTEQKKIDKVEIGDQSISYTLKKDEKTIYQTETMETDTALSQRLYDAGATFTRVHTKEMNPWLSFLITGILPIILLFWFGNHMFKKMQKKMGGDAMSFGGGGLGGFGKSDAKIYVKSQTGKTFLDVAGQEEAKAALQEMVEFLKSPQRYTQIGAQMPNGALLVGPPGTGKTLLAKAVAGEANVPFFSISGSEFVEMFVGRGAARVRDLFKQAREKAPCIVFIDEIDTIGKKRDGAGVGGNDEREQTLNQLLVEMDGITDNAGIVVIAATNRPDVLDPALLRPGRFDRQITVSLPDRRGRKAILEVHARNKKLAPEIDLDALAKRTPGFSGADLENVLNEAAILAVRENSDLIHMHNLDEAIDRVMMGPAKKSRKYDEKSKKLVAYHESGHAIVGLNLENSNIVQKVTIIPRGTAGGYNLMTPKEEKIMNTKNDLMSAITGYMGGRVAEEVFFDDITTGAVNDIEQATKMARDMVTLYGMSDLGPVQYDHGQQNVFLGRDYNSSSNVSGQVAFEIDQEIRKIIDQCHDEAKKIILEHKEELIKIAEALIENETLTAEQIDKIIKGEPFLDLPTPEMKAAAASSAEPESPTVVETEETSQPETETE